MLCDGRFCEFLAGAICSCRGRCVRDKASGSFLLGRLRSRGFIASLDAGLFNPRLAVPLWVTARSEEPFPEGRRVVDAGIIDLDEWS